MIPGTSDEQKELREILRDLFTSEAQKFAARETLTNPHLWNQELWSKLARELGVLGLGVSEEYGGSGGSIVDAAILHEEAGRLIVPGAFVGSLMLGVPLLQSIAAESIPAAEMLKDICAGSTIVTVVLDITHDLDAQSNRVNFNNASGVLNGEVVRVIDAHRAGQLLVVALDEEGAVVLIELSAQASGVTITEQLCLDSTVDLGRVEFNGAIGAVLARGESVSKAVQEMNWTAEVLISARQLGIARGALEMSVEYAKLRQQFGRAIGSFQAIKHILADVHVEIVSAAAALTSSLREENYGNQVRSSIARSTISDALWLAASENIQVHGGVGFTWELDAHLFFKSAVVYREFFDTAEYHRERIARLILPSAVLDEPTVQI